MKPKFLEIEGLQSFRDIQRIDFEVLGETGLFGIFGPTGSGKSTILDAITFALYGKVKRAKEGTQGIINTDLNIARVSFTFELLKDGVRKSFRVERTYRKKKGTANSCEPRIARLIEITDDVEIPVCEKVTDVSGNIKELLGLNHDDFTRAVVIPQNSFQEFLLLNNSDRKKMLERIFYLEEYGEGLKFKLNRRMTKLKSNIDILSGELKGYEDATEEVLEEAKKELDKTLSERSRIEEELTLMEAKFNEAKNVWDLTRELLFIEQEEQKHLVVKESYTEKRRQLEKSVKADGMVEIIIKNKELGKKLRGTERQLDEVRTAISSVDTNLSEMRQRYEKIKNKEEIEQPNLLRLRTRLEDALGTQEEIQAIEVKIRQIQVHASKLKDEITNKSGVIKNETRELEVFEKKLGALKLEMEPLKTEPEYRQYIQEGVRLENELEVLNKNVNDIQNNTQNLRSIVIDLEKKLNTIREEILSSEKALNDLTEEKLKHESIMPEDKNSVIKYIEKIHCMQAVCDVLKVRKNELDGICSKIAKNQSEFKVLQHKELLLREDKGKKDIFFNQCKLELEDAIREMDKNVACMLSKNLKEGEPCSVCGSKCHPDPAALKEGIELSMLEECVDEARKRLADAEAILKESEKKGLVVGEQIKALSTQIGQVLWELNFKIEEYNTEKKKLPEELRDLELDQIHFELEKMNVISAKKIDEFDIWGKKQEEYKDELLRINNKMSELRILENGVLTELKINGEGLEQMEKSLDKTTNSLSEKQQSYLEFLNQNKINSAILELKKLAENDRRMSMLQKQIEQVQESITSKRTLLEQWKEELSKLNSEDIKVQTDINNLNIQKVERESKLKGLIQNARIEDEIRNIDKKLEEYAENKKQCTEKLQELEKHYNDLMAQKSLLINQQNIYSETLKDEEARLKNAILDRGFKDLSEVEASVLSLESQKSLKDEIDEYDRNGSKIQTEKEMVQKKLNSRNISQDEWNRISSIYKELVFLKEQYISKSEIAKNSFENLKNKHDKWVELNDSYKKLSYKQGLFEHIQKLLRAESRKDNSFVDFIAEERLRYVAVKASEILGIMTKYKYALELDTEAGFIIRDNANGGIHRMVASLSGGETFLTSLSLALALSEQIQLKGQSPLEFFFLDEGFGTLDNDLLDLVIDALECLSKKERVIGLISHVPEIRSRIARRLIVDPPTLQGDGSRVKIEKA